MDKTTLLASIVILLLVAGVVAYRLIGQLHLLRAVLRSGRLPVLPKAWRRWLLGDRTHQSPE